MEAAFEGMPASHTAVGCLPVAWPCGHHSANLVAVCSWPSHGRHTALPNLVAGGVVRPAVERVLDVDNHPTQTRRVGRDAPQRTRRERPQRAGVGAQRCLEAYPRAFEVGGSTEGEEDPPLPRVAPHLVRKIRRPDSA